MSQEVAEQVIQSGKANKTSKGELIISFPIPFKTTPNVVVSPYWENENAPVGSIETIDSISTRNFTVVSKNAGKNYFVNWVAVGT